MRSILSLRRSPREHIADTDRPVFIARREGHRFGVAMLHGGRELHWWPLEEARREGANLIKLANLAARPGEFPLEDLG